MKILDHSLILFILGSLASCSNITKPKAANFTWESEIPRKGVVNDILLIDGDRVYIRHYSKTMGGHLHSFMKNEKVALIISDDITSSVLGAGLTFAPEAKATVMTEDLNKDSKVDIVFIDDSVYGRCKDGKFAPISDSMSNKLDSKSEILRYLSTRSSEQDAAPNP